MSIQESAIAYHNGGCNCAQSVLAALQEETGGEICGSITGAVMAFGLAADQATATAMTKQMTQSFRAEFGCLRCQELVAKNGGKGHCAHMIAWGAQRAEEILAENKVEE